jgi:outer membrane protein assembly factor BamB
MELTTELWRVPLEPNGDGDVGPSLLAGTSDLVIVGTAGEPEVMDRRTGARLATVPWPWLQLPPDGRWAAPIQTFVDGDALVTVDLATGAVRDRVPIEPLGGVRGRVDVTALPRDDRVLAAGTEVRRVGPGGATRWSVTRDGDAWPEAVDRDGDVLVVRDWSQVDVHDLATGERRWSVPVSSHGRSSSLLHDGRVYVIASATVRAHHAVTGDELWETLELPQSADLLGVVGGVLYATVAGPAQEVARYDVATGERLRGVPLPAASVARGAATAEVLLVDGVLVVREGPMVVGRGLDGRERWRVPGRSMAARGTGHVDVLDGDRLVTVEASFGGIVEETTLELPPAGGTAWTTLTTSGGSVALSDGRILALASGEQLADLAPDDHGWTQPLAVAGGYVYPDPETWQLRAVDPYGGTRWEAPGDRLRGSLPAVVGDGLLVVGADGESGPELAVLDPATGARFDDVVATAGVDDVQLSDGRWVVGSSRHRGPDAGELVVLERDGDELVEAWRADGPRGWPAVWDAELLLERTATAVLRRRLDDGSELAPIRLPTVATVAAFAGDGFVFATPDDRLLGTDPRSGELRWELAPGGVLTQALAVAGDVAYVGTRDGRVHLVRVGDGRLLDTVRVGHAPVSRVAVAHGMLLAAVGDEVVAFGPPPGRLRVPELPPRQLGEVDVPVP